MAAAFILVACAVGGSSVYSATQMFGAVGSSPSEPQAPLAESYAVFANARFFGAVTGPQPQRGARLDDARAATVKELELYPASASGWLRLASISQFSGQPDPTVIVPALEKAYRLDPVDPQLAPTRVRISVLNWRALSPELQDRALSEVQTICAPPAGEACRNLRASLAPTPAA